MARPKNAALYEDDSDFDAASLYAHGITKSQAFNDGNKRPAFMAADTFLALNPLEINSSEKAARTYNRRAPGARVFNLAGKRFDPDTPKKSSPKKTKENP